MFGFLNALGRLIFVLFCIGLPFKEGREYLHVSHQQRRVLLGIIALALLALLALVSLVLIVTNTAWFKNPNMLLIGLFDLSLLVYSWTSPSVKWTSRRKNRRSLLIMLLLTAILLVALVIGFLGAI